MLVRDDFVGVWTLQRNIDDRHLAQNGDFRGQAKMRPNGDGLDYEETGKVKLGAGPLMTATRAYRWCFRTARVDVAFADGSPFHSFVPTGASAGTDHPCGDDFYQVNYDFTDWPAWTATWVVSGPRKDYTSVSFYAPAR